MRAVRLSIVRPALVLASCALAWAPRPGRALVACSNHCQFPSLSADGRVVAFLSQATNWHGKTADEETNDYYHVVVCHLPTRAVKVQVFTCDAGYPQVSGDGRWVAYERHGDPLMGADTNGFWDVYVARVAFGSNGNDIVGPVGISRSALDGRFGNLYSGRPRISHAGRFVAFESRASNLTADDINAKQDIFVRDRDADADGIFDETNAPGAVATVLVSRQPDESLFGVDCTQPYISADGRYVAFTALGASGAFYVRDRDVGGDGRFDEPGDVRTWYAFKGGYGYGSDLSPDGRFAVYREWIGGRTKLGMFDWAAFKGILVGVPPSGIASGAAGHPSLGQAGHFLAFQSDMTNLVTADDNGCYDVFVRAGNPDNWTNTLGYELISATPAGRPANNHSGGGWTYWYGYTGPTEESGLAMTPDGRYVAFLSLASNLVANDANTVRNFMALYVRDRGADTVPGHLSVSGATVRVEADFQAPGWPAGARAWATNAGADAAMICWTPATDDVGVLYYRVTVTGRPPVTVTAACCRVTGLAGQAACVLEITPFDGAWNIAPNNANRWTVTVPLAPPATPRAVGADVDGDRKADPVMVTGNEWTFWLSGGGYAPLGPIPFGTAGARPAAGDFDGDGQADPVMVAGNQWTFWLSGGGYAPLGPIPFGAAGARPAAADFDGDGQADPAMVKGNQWTFWLSGGGYAPLGPFPFGAAE